MKIHLCLYSNEKYKSHKDRLISWAQYSGVFDSIFSYDREWLEKEECFQKFQNVFDHPNNRGDGWWLWKPIVIKNALENVEYGECVFYLDSSDTFFSEIRNWLESHFSRNDFLLSRAGFNKNGDYTKMDCFFYMDCMSSDYYNCLQLEAGVVGFKKTDKTINFINEWIKYCSDLRIVSNDENVCGFSNLPGFISHRNDQSVLTILKQKYGLGDTRDIFRYIECNFLDSDQQETLRKIGAIKEKISQNEFEIWMSKYFYNL